MSGGVRWNFYRVRPKSEKTFDSLMELAQDCLQEIKDKAFKAGQAQLLNSQLTGTVGKREENIQALAGKSSSSGPADKADQDKLKKDISDRDRKINALAAQLKEAGITPTKAAAAKS